MTVLQLLSDALGELNVIGPGDPLEDDDAQTALRVFQRLNNTFNADRLFLYQVQRTLFPLAIGQQVRTIGAGGNFNVARPVTLAHVGVVPVGQTYEMPVIPYVNREEWLAEPWKAQTDLYPSRYLYEPKYPLGEFTFWPIPTTAAQVALGLPQALAAPATLVTDLVFPEGYHHLYHTNLVELLAPAFQTVASADQKQLAKDARGTVKRYNDPGPPDAKFDPGLTGAGGWDIQSGSYRR